MSSGQPVPTTSSATSPTLADPAARSAYVHVPFCRHRCGYCDFTLVANRDDLIARYLVALQRELEQLESPAPVDTLFLGGGTPTHLPPSDLYQLTELLRHWTPLQPLGEFSTEANPSGLDQARIEILARAGVNRVSLGVQSFHPQHLQTLERDHTPEEVALVVERLRPLIPNISLDLIFAVPGQTLADWAETLSRAIDLAPQHISTYGLTWEKGTSFWNRKERGQLRAADEELEREMYALAMDQLAAAGFEHYELSNFAQPGFRCRHNQVYWQGTGYYGFGPGAASYLHQVRRLNHRSVTSWMSRILNQQSAVQEEESLSPEERAREAIMLGLRQRDGIALIQYELSYGCTPQSLEPQAFERHLQQGLCEIVDGRWRLTREGCFVADQVMSDYL